MEYIFPGCIARTKRKIRQYVEYSYPSGKTQKVVAAKHHSQQHQQYYDLLRYCVFHDIVVCLFLLPIRSLNRIAVPVYTCEWLINNLWEITVGLYICIMYNVYIYVSTCLYMYVYMYRDKGAINKYFQSLEKHWFYNINFIQDFLII